MMRYLAIDPGVKACGLAWRGRDKAIYAFSDGDGAFSFIRGIKGGTNACNPTHAVIEQTNGYAGSLKAAFALAEVRGRLIEACKQAGLEVVRVNVSTWQADMLGKTRKGRTKEASIESARSLGMDTDDHNVADAVNILVYSELNKLGEPE